MWLNPSGVSLISPKASDTIFLFCWNSSIADSFTRWKCSSEISIILVYLHARSVSFFGILQNMIYNQFYTQSSLIGIIESTYSPSNLHWSIPKFTRILFSFTFQLVFPSGLCIISRNAFFSSPFPAILSSTFTHRLKTIGFEKVISLYFFFLRAFVISSLRSGKSSFFIWGVATSSGESSDFQSLFHPGLVTRWWSWFRLTWASL